jgi:hypothetical protein
MNMTLRGAVSTSLLVLLSLAPHAAHAADQVIQTEHGYKLVSDGSGKPFTVEISGKEVRQQHLDVDPLIFSVDKMVLQVVCPEINGFLNAGKRKKMDDRGVLTFHRDFEAEYLEESNQTKFNIESSWRTLENGREALLWTFKMPADRTKNVTEQIYLTTLAGNRVLMLVTSLTAQTDREASIQLLLNTASTLKMTGKP